MTRHRLFNLLLLPAFLLAHLVCVCGGSMAQVHPNVAAKSHRDGEHACCRNRDADALNQTSQGQNSGHDSKCPHCTQVKQIVIAERGISPDLQPAISPFDLLAPLFVDVTPVDAANRVQFLAGWLSDPSPPPDLLRVKCALLI